MSAPYSSADLRGSIYITFSDLGFGAPRRRTMQLWYSLSLQCWRTTSWTSISPSGT